MVYGSNTSGFGWDPERKVVTADKEVWEEYLKVYHPTNSVYVTSIVHFFRLLIEVLCCFEVS